MPGLTHPIEFKNIEEMDQFYSDFKKKAVQICQKYDVPELWDNVRVYRDNASLEMSITSIGSYIKDSNEEKAADEIIDTFNSL